MSARALADLLTDFGAQPSREAAPFDLPSEIEPEPAMDLPPLLDPEEEITARIAEAVAAAEAAAAEKVSAIYEATLEAEREQHAAERDALSRSLGSEAAELIESRLAAMEEQLVTLTTAAAARILGGILTDELQKRAVASLAAKIREAVGERDAVRIRVLGPQSLCEALSGALGPHAASVEFAERPSFDVTVAIDSSIYETRIAEWSAELAEVVA